MLANLLEASDPTQRAVVCPVWLRSLGFLTNAHNLCPKPGRHGSTRGGARPIPHIFRTTNPNCRSLALLSFPPSRLCLTVCSCAFAELGSSNASPAWQKPAQLPPPSLSTQPCSGWSCRASPTPFDSHPRTSTRQLMPILRYILRSGYGVAADLPVPVQSDPVADRTLARPRSSVRLPCSGESWSSAGGGEQAAELFATKGPRRGSAI